MESVLQKQAGARFAPIVEHCLEYRDKAAGFKLADFMPYEIVGPPNPIDNAQPRRSWFD